MSSVSLSPARLPDRQQPERRGVTLLTITASIYLFVTGVAVFEGRVVYPSWLDLAPFTDFATYHSNFGRALLPWLPAPLVAATVLTAILLWRAPASIPRATLAVMLAGQLFVIGVTAAVAIPIQRQLGTPGHTPDEIRALITRLMDLNLLREAPGVAVALAFAWMLHRALQSSDAPAGGA